MDEMMMWNKKNRDGVRNTFFRGIHLNAGSLGLWVKICGLDEMRVGKHVYIYVCAYICDVFVRNSLCVGLL